MEYVLTFIEGIISFISPCMLPLLPVFISFFAASEKPGDNRRNTIFNAVAFVLGFTVVFTLLGVFAGTAGQFLNNHSTVVNIVCGAIVVILGLAYLGVIPLNFLKGISGKYKADNVLSAFLFGIIYSVSLTPCVGAFLGSALMLAATTGGAFKGFTLLLVYSLGLGIPFILSAIIIDKTKEAFDFIKKHYDLINKISGIFLIVVGLLMMAGLLNKMMAMFA